MVNVMKADEAERLGRAEGPVRVNLFSDCNPLTASGGHGGRTRNPFGQLISNQPASHSLILRNSYAFTEFNKLTIGYRGAKHEFGSQAILIVQPAVLTLATVTP